MSLDGINDKSRVGIGVEFHSGVTRIHAHAYGSDKVMLREDKPVALSAAFIDVICTVCCQALFM